jgi:phage terminase large subunit-like protein
MSVLKHAYTERIQFPSRLDKGMRAQSMRAMIAARGLWFAQNLKGRHDLESELLAFPNGRHDDQHDALGLVGQLLDMAVHGYVPAKPKKTIASGYRTIKAHTALDTSLIV